MGAKGESMQLGNHLPPEVRSEINARMLKQVDSLRELFKEAGPEMEEFIQTTWMAGYTEAICELAAWRSGGQVSPLLESVFRAYGDEAAS